MLASSGRDPGGDPGGIHSLSNHRITHGYPYSVYFFIGYTSYRSCCGNTGMKPCFLFFQSILVKVLIPSGEFITTSKIPAPETPLCRKWFPAPAVFLKTPTGDGNDPRVRVPGCHDCKYLSPLNSRYAGASLVDRGVPQILLRSALPGDPDAPAKRGKPGLYVSYDRRRPLQS